MSQRTLAKARGSSPIASAVLTGAVGVVWAALLLINAFVRTRERDARHSNLAQREQALVPARSLSPPARQAQPATRRASSEAVQTLEQQRRALLGRMQAELGLSAAALSEVAAIFAASPVLGQGNPALSQHALGRQRCRERLSSAPLHPADAACGAPYMVLLRGERAGPETPRACIDQFEFPNLPCEYPVVHVRASESVQLCAALGKRICDAHEWEGACAGALRPAAEEYAWGHSRARMQWLHNLARERVWAYGRRKQHALCAITGERTPGCPGGGFEACGSLTAPSGAHPECVSPLGVYDLHGNVAEHMNLPLSARDLASAGGLGVTEMKGSWFGFGERGAHPDDCRWRAPDWHASRLSDPNSHRNYHLGFRCCKSL